MSLTALLRKRKLAVALIEKKEELLAAPPQPAPQRARFSSASAAADDTVFNLSSDEEAEEGKPLGGFLLSRVGIDVPMAQHYMDFVKDGNIFPSVRWICEPIWCATADTRLRCGTPRYFPECVTLCGGLSMEQVYAVGLKLPVAKVWRVADTDPAARKWMQSVFPNNIVYKSNRQLIDDVVARRAPVKVLTAGGCCAPFSDMRRHTMRALPPQRHKLFEVTFGEKGCEAGSFIEAMETLRPEVALYENVGGFLRVVPRSFDAMLHASGATWGDLLMKKVSRILNDDGTQRYSMQKIHMDPGSWIKLSRFRLHL